MTLRMMMQDVAKLPFKLIARIAAIKHYRNVWLIFNQFDGELSFIWPQVTCPHTYPTVIHRTCGKPFSVRTNNRHVAD